MSLRIGSNGQIVCSPQTAWHLFPGFPGLCCLTQAANTLPSVSPRLRDLAQTFPSLG